MFDFFKRSAPSVNVIDKVWMYKHSKMNACADMLRLSPNCLFLAWFEETYKELQQLLGAEDNLKMAQDVMIEQTRNRMIVFAEHHPLASIEHALFSKLGLHEVPVLSSLDEPFFQNFGGEKVIDMMKKLGMKEDEIIGHTLITRSIANAQKSIAKRAHSNIQSKSQQEWFSINMK